VSFIGLLPVACEAVQTLVARLARRRELCAPGYYTPGQEKGDCVLTLLAITHAPPPKPFVPRDFVVPEALDWESFRLRVLTVDHADADFEAVASSREHLQALFGDAWPQDLTEAQNRIDLAWHQKEFQRRTSFAYTVLAVDTDRVLGCVYVSPSLRPHFDAEVRYWVRSSELASGLQEKLGNRVADWMEDAWPFINPRYVPRLRSPRSRLH
jgi:RimJ/RimL family protein N-acetyltransferase